MVKKSLALCWVLGMASFANAGAVIELVPQTPGPYNLGDSINLDVVIHNEEVDPIIVRLFQWDTTLTEVPLNDQFSFNNVIIAGVYFHADQEVFADYPRPAQIFKGSGPTFTEIPGFFPRTPNFHTLPPVGDSFRSGTMNVTIPADAADGPYLVDVLNSGQADVNLGGIISFGFGASAEDPLTTWRGFTGELQHGILEAGLAETALVPGFFQFNVSGGSATFEFVPEPATLSLLLVGGLATLRHRRRRAV